MSKDKKPKPRGRRSYVLAGKSHGGQIVTRIDKDLHQQLAKYCKDRGVSMNQYVAQLIEESLEAPPCQPN